MTSLPGLRTMLLLAAVLANLGCAGGLEGPPTGAGGTMGTGGTQGSCAPSTGPTPCDAVGTIFATQRCSMSNCHGAIGPEGIDLMSPGLVARLLGVKSESPVCGGNAMPYLERCSNPARGLLLDKLTQVPPACGEPMPYGGFGGELNPQELACINEWATAVTTGRITP